MFQSIQTTNFRKLQNGNFTFSQGLNAVRGPNEQGKSSLFEAIAYAMFGSDALREPLSDVVTWGEKESSLKVVLNLTINSSVVEIRRGKSGAEIRVDSKLVATGQSEVTRFVEGLLGTPPKVAAKLMLANQASLRGALSEGPTATSKLIEQLSNFALIDEIIALVQEKLPSGSATAAEQQVKTLAAQLESGKPEELDLSTHEAELRSTLKAQEAEHLELGAAQAELPAAKAAADQARGWATALEKAKANKAAAVQALARDREALARLQPASKVSPEQVEALRAAVTAANQFESALAAHRAAHKLGRPEVEWTGSRESFDAAYNLLNEEAKDTARRLSDLEVEYATLSGRLIKEQACAFCGKDLKDVPEVVALNTELGVKLAAISTQMLTLGEHRREQHETQLAYAEILRNDRAVRELFAKHHSYLELGDETVPPTLYWKGPDVSVAPPTDALVRLREAEAEVQRAARDQGRKVELDAAVASSQKTLEQAEQWIAELEPKLVGDRSAGLEKDLQTKIRYHEDRIKDLQAQASRVGMAMDHLKQLHATQVAAYGRLQAAYAAAQEQLEDLQLNNVLLKKLRGARPKVADKLWGTVLATVSHYFSAIRGVQSAVSKDDAGFKVDGKPVPGLSGSTLDALGLAIRIALTKTFLPNNDFLILDEPAAACDDNREANMLGVITTAGFAQVLLVTHSVLADPFADQVIEL